MVSTSQPTRKASTAMQTVKDAGYEWINPAPVPAWDDGIRMIGVRGPSGEHVKLVQKQK